MEVVPTCRSPAPRTCTAAESRARSAPLAITLGVARTAASRHYRAREPGPALGRDGHRRREASTAHRGTTLTMRRPRHDSGHRSRSATDLYSISTGSSEPSKIAPEDGVIFLRRSGPTRCPTTGRDGPIPGVTRPQKPRTNRGFSARAGPPVEDLRHLRRDRADPAAGHLPGHQRDPHSVTTFGGTGAGYFPHRSRGRWHSE